MRPRVIVSSWFRLSPKPLPSGERANLQRIPVVVVLVEEAGVRAGREVAKEYDGRVQVDDRIVDACAMQLVMNPWQFDVIVTTNLFGDILSDQLAGLVGGLGMAPGAPVGPNGLAVGASPSVSQVPNGLTGTITIPSVSSGAACSTVATSPMGTFGSPTTYDGGGGHAAVSVSIFDSEFSGNADTAFGGYGGGLSIFAPGTPVTIARSAAFLTARLAPFHAAIAAGAKLVMVSHHALREFTDF